MRVLPRVQSACGFATACVALIGCANTPTSPARIASDEQIVAGSPDQTGAWLFWPTSLRVHPLTRIDRSTTPPSVDLRVEFQDALGQSTRVVGTVVVELESTSGEPSQQRWRFDVNSLEAHARFFESVTETYRFRIAPEWTRTPAAGSAVRVNIYLFGANGATPTATQQLNW
ncbi:MAG: hypothetical protein U0572_05220 [Phycisphaerales bacterium]